MASQCEHDARLEDEASDSSDVDLEDALARAILGDVVGPRHGMPGASTATLRDADNEEHLIERLHARLFPVTSSSGTTASMVHPRQLQSRESTRLAKPTNGTRLPQQPTTAPVPVQPRRSISPEKVDQMLTRFRLHETKRSRELELIKQQGSVSSMGSSASSDLVSPRSRELARDLPSFHQRQALALAKRERDIDRQRQHDEQQQHDLSDALARAVRTPCICGSASGSQVRSESHSPACVRFMEACEKTNGTSVIQRKKQHMRRTVDDMMQFHEAAKRKQAEMAENQRRRELREATFAPQLNKKSIRIYEEMIQSGRLQGNRSTRSLQLSLASPLPTRPKLCAKSKLVLTNTRRASITSRSSSGSRSSIWTGRRRPSHSLIPKAASFSESHWASQASTGARKDTPPTSPQPPPFVVPWTGITYDATSCDFILTNFDQPAWFR